MKKLVIDVKCWGRDNYYNKGKFCAVGFLARQHLLEKGEVVNEDTIDFAIMKLPLKKIAYITKANDDLSGKERRDRLTKLFAEQGYKLVFKNL